MQRSSRKHDTAFRASPIIWSRRFAAFLVAGVIVMAPDLTAQSIGALDLSSTHGLEVRSYRASDGKRVSLPSPLSLFTLELNDTLVGSNQFRASARGDSIVLSSGRGLSASVKAQKDFSRGWKAILTLSNSSDRKLQIANVVPLGEQPDHIFVKSAGPQDQAHRLSRSQLFRPGVGPIGVVLPDNAWELGFCDVAVASGRRLSAIARRTSSDRADVRRFRTILDPGGFVQYTLYVDEHRGDWREGLRLMCQKRWLYDLEKFDNTLFERPDLAWIRHSYLMVLQFPWDHQYYDQAAGGHQFTSFLPMYDRLLGGWDAFMIWPTWPRLGLDQRNQWDMYRDLPGGLPELRRQAEFAHGRGTRYFIAYNPWDESTRREDHIRGMEEILRSIDADGVVLDTWGESSKSFQDAVDRVKPGVILYSEGMAVPKDMPTIVAGRVHDAIFLPPPLNLNKLIKPEFAIFRVAQLAEGRIHRESAVAFFNGYGTEMNIMRPGRPDWVEEEFRFLGKTTKILRENSPAFLSPDWVPLLETTVDSIWVNAWPTASKTLYTVLSMRPEGYQGPLFEVPIRPGFHLVSLWHHEELASSETRGNCMVPATLDGFSRSWLDSRREGSVDCIAMLPTLLKTKREGDSLTFESTSGTKIVVWAGMPSYDTRSREFGTGNQTVSLYHLFGRYEGKIVVQLFDSSGLMDERVFSLPLAMARMISSPMRVASSGTIPDGMVEIPGGLFIFKSARSFVSPNEFISYPETDTARAVTMKKFFVDRYPVTNVEFEKFLKATHYIPRDTVNFLRHWVNGAPPKGVERHPVVFVGMDDAKAYARWAGKRLPTEIEWQYAAQGSDGRKYPWGPVFDSSRCNVGRSGTTPVDAFPSGQSPFGVQDLIGNVWQLTGDEYDNGTFYYSIIRGGSYYDPTSSWWYIKGGPQPVDNPQILLRLSPGFDRCATVGFRCVKDE